MANTGYLKDVRCPNCGADDCVMVAATVVLEMTDDNIDFASPEYVTDSGENYTIAEDAQCVCSACKHGATWAEFHAG